MITRTPTVAMSLALASCVLFGCDKKEGTSGTSDNPLDKVKTAASDAAGKAKEEVGKKIEEGYAALRDSAAGAAEKTLAEAKSQIGRLKEKASSASAEVKPAMDSAIKSIEDQAAKVQAKLPELKSATSDTWKSISESVSKEASTLMTMIKDAAAKYGVK
ncbi:MAG: hypothetical protein JNK58_04960 [Phycisphaerae bacterium]|nr:hypothetical protein [Phycisphaerae bacterium]